MVGIFNTPHSSGTSYSEPKGSDAKGGTPSGNTKGVSGFVGGNPALPDNCIVPALKSAPLAVFKMFGITVS